MGCVIGVMDNDENVESVKDENVEDVEDENDLWGRRHNLTDTDKHTNSRKTKFGVDLNSLVVFLLERQPVVWCHLFL